MNVRAGMEKTTMKMKKIAVCVAVCLILCGTCALVFREQSHSAGEGKNLALQKGVTATSDSSENDTLLAAMAIDGNDWDLQSRWSSENNWEDASHYIELEFPEEISVSFVVIESATLSNSAWFFSIFLLFFKTSFANFFAAGSSFNKVSYFFFAISA